MSSPGAKAITVVFVGIVSWYGALKFWQPIVIEQLKKDGNLKEGIFVPEDDQPKSWQDLKDKVNIALHPPNTDPKLTQEFEKQKRETEK
ncbi:hypothetical protein CLIB1423_09S03730 [[Candida] railenensis]|uniref:Uncharacterized protein n=1 Tax=[Candida] railenensis TaxID=45579 RepID=A0A9P0QQL8_9ASCO|nr:hypothetical protein CLIB1423_09S03730 [[Candida] railenensis]